MIRLKLSELTLSPAADQDALLRAAAKLLSLPAGQLSDLTVLRRAVDSRRKPDVKFVYTAAVTVPDGSVSKAMLADRRVSLYEAEAYAFPVPSRPLSQRPVVVGMGPAGLFAALCLAEAGAPPLILERGQPVERRQADVERFWNGGPLDESSNVQFGEGGAGTFSDGKLTTGVNDTRIGFVFQRLVEFGAPEDILYLAAPHVGTDRLRRVVAGVRERLLKLGCEIRYGTTLTALEAQGGTLTGIRMRSDAEEALLPCEKLILAPGNAARDTFAMLAASGVRLESKAFSVGVRIEHLQREMDLVQYGQAATLGTLPASGYKLAVHLASGRSVYSFCVCPGGSVVAAASESGGVVTNGMSDYARDGENINGGLLVGVTPEDWHGIFGGVEFQRTLEHAAFASGGGNYCAPAQLVGDFLQKRPSAGPGRVHPTYRPGVRWCSLWNVLPAQICQALAEALPLMERKIRGFASPDAVMTAVETRSSCPIRILRDESGQASLRGLFPCGEGAGYAGGITSAAVDGIRAAEALLS